MQKMLFKRLAKIQMKDGRLEHYFEAVFPRSEAQKKKRRKAGKMEVLARGFRDQKTTYNCPAYAARSGEPTTPSRGLKTTSNRSRKNSRTNGLERTWFGGGADTKLKALSKAAELASSWN